MADHDALERALQKIATLELTDDEVNALAEALASDDDVEGFALSPKAGRGWIIIESIVPDRLREGGIEPPAKGKNLFGSDGGVGELRPRDDRG